MIMTMLKDRSSKPFAYKLIIIIKTVNNWSKEMIWRL